MLRRPPSITKWTLTVEGREEREEKEEEEEEELAIEPHKTREELIAALKMTAGWDYSRGFNTGVLQT